ncbi:hypothetical protein BDV36DRAFT_269150 [Aspergillus pseudocaelatus]|uniref:Uncharacterized protein n=1 Tax=Aspergillus pseudocaelatus TaxID=1825620 RepID=A0ABQ6W7T1_9EURO|nr:hypothetical protein BDV36DRAFT_269150 [Aspergillus pseudocaelatus]
MMILGGQGTESVELGLLARADLKYMGTLLRSLIVDRRWSVYISGTLEMLNRMSELDSWVVVSIPTNFTGYLLLVGRDSYSHSNWVSIWSRKTKGC